MIDVQEFLSLRHTLPVVDVRSEGEHGAGHIRHAHNIPILNNGERIAVGTDFKQKGQQEAIRTGFRLVGPRLADMLDRAVGVGNELLVYCWRGGMRSANFCQFAHMSRIKTHQLRGGYKAYRQLAFASYANPFQLIVLGGCTGSGKSEVLRALKAYGEQVIDLEALANHKGSAFGGLMMPAQPTTEQFQNDLFEQLLTLDIGKRIWIEDESIAIGKIFLPHALWERMGESCIVEIAVDKPTRVQRLTTEYGTADKTEFLEAMKKITKKLGGQHFESAKEKLLAGDMGSTIDILLTYYDKAYRNALEKKKNRIALHAPWQGDNAEDFARHLVDELNHVAAKASV